MSIRYDEVYKRQEKEKTFTAKNINFNFLLIRTIRIHFVCSLFHAVEFTICACLSFSIRLNK